uniref:Uncharacterized protein n=3 Tax=Entomoneis paludosa TaxID=265537 RepID=A0A7S2YC39_9STRA|mmetsp:Transcript_26734/g.55971  ORF Transcript_26734/g.55971 Transcript_26734/m.55971 type:complete len:545 (+) Transcript_26734:81-1715(+)
MAVADQQQHQSSRPWNPPQHHHPPSYPAPAAQPQPQHPFYHNSLSAGASASLYQVPPSWRPTLANSHASYNSTSNSSLSSHETHLAAPPPPTEDHHHSRTTSHSSNVDDGSVLLSLLEAGAWTTILAWVAAHPRSLISWRDEEGRTALHVACSHDAPAVVIQALLQAWPAACLETASTPLHVTCASWRASLAVVRVLCEAAPAQLTRRDPDGDLPLHAACRCGAPTSVLNVLVQAHPAAVHERDEEGLTPLLRLWVRYFVTLGSSSSSSSSATEDVLSTISDRHDARLQSSTPLGQALEKTQLLLQTAFGGNETCWVHAAAAVDCPRSIVQLMARLYPEQLTRSHQGRTPLVWAAQAPIYQVRDLTEVGYNTHRSSDSYYYQDDGEEFDYDQYERQELLEQEDDNDQDVLAPFAARPVPMETSTSSVLPTTTTLSSTASTQPSVIEILVQANPLAATIPGPQGRLPLHEALATRKTWSQGVAALVRVHAHALSCRNAQGLLPFQMAAVAVRKPPEAPAASDDADLTTILELLWANPSCLIHDMS